MKKKRETKYLVIGSTGHRFVGCIDWETDPLPNIIDHDVIIANMQAITETLLKKLSYQGISSFRELIIRFLESSGMLIVLTDNLKYGTNENSYPKRYSNYSWLPINIGICQEEGDTIEEVENPFPKYFSKFRSWEYFLYTPQKHLTYEIKQWFGNPYYVDYSCVEKPYLQNREKQTLAGAYHWSIIPTSKGKRDYTTTELGPIIFLPLLKGIDYREAINLLLEDLIGKSQITLPPSWADKVSMPLLAGIQKKIDKHSGKIEKISEEISELEKQKSELEYYKKLLYADGSELEDVFKKCLIELGAQVNPPKHAEEEYCMLYKNKEYPVEAKGDSKSISLTDLRQLIDYLLIYDEKTGQENKGILIGNAWKKLPLGQRNTKQKPVFPSNVEKRAKASNIALVSSVDFFKAFCGFLKDKSLAPKILNCIVSSTGVVDFSKIIS